MIRTFIVSSGDDDQTRQIAGEIEAALNAPMSPEVQALLDSLPTRYDVHDYRFAPWVAVMCERAGLPQEAALRLIDDARLYLVDVYPNFATGEIVVCPSDVSAWCRSHVGQEPRQTVQAWWQSVTQ